MSDTECLFMAAQVGKCASITVESISKILFLPLLTSIKGTVQKHYLLSDAECIFMTAHVGKCDSINAESVSKYLFLPLPTNFNGTVQRYT